jgi:hypothetical protein
MGTPTPEQQLRTALDSALAATFDFGIRTLKDPAGSPLPTPKHPANSPARRSDEMANPGVRTSCVPPTQRQVAHDRHPRQSREHPPTGRGTHAGDRPHSHSPLSYGDRRDRLVANGTGDRRRRRTCRQLVLSLIGARRAAQVAKELENPEGRSEGLARNREF